MVYGGNIMINVVYSTEHLIVPRIVTCIIVILALAIIILEGRARQKCGQGFFAKPDRFFKADADFVKLFGSLILFIAYIFLMEILGFTFTSIVFVFLFNVLYAGFEKKSLIISAIIAIVASLLISIAFGVVFQITLPSGLFSVTFVDYGFTIY